MNKGISLLAQFPPFLHRTEVSRSSVSHASRRFLTTRITPMFKVGIRKEMQVICLEPVSGSVQGSYFFKVTKQVQQHTPSKVFMLPLVHQSHNYILLGRLRTRKHPNALPLVLSKSYFILLSTDIKLKGRRRKRGWEQRKETSLILLLSVLPPPILFPLKKNKQKNPRIHVANNTNYFNISLFQ